jgi:hypothetical protein
MPTPILDQTLSANRARYNAKFAEARHYRPRLNGEAFADVLRTLVAPSAEAVYETQPEAVEAVTETLYEVSLDLLAQDFIGPASRYPVIASGWVHVLPKLARFIATDPQGVVGAVTNALYNIATTPGTRPGEWMRDMIRLADLCDTVDTLLQAGQVCSWRAGLAHYRAEALAIAATLPLPVARLALGLPATDTQPIEAVIQRLRSSPWQTPTASEAAPLGQLKIQKRVGAFRGFGGLFIVPPIVEPAGEHFLVTDGESTWLLTADAFGVTFHRSPKTTESSKPETPFKLNRNGEVSANKIKQTFPELVQSTSQAANKHTLAVTVPYSHAVYLVGSG